MVPIKFRSAPFRNFSANWFASAAQCSLSLAAFCLLTVSASGAENSAPAEKSAPAGEKKQEAAAEPADETANMTAMMIKGQDVKGMRYAHRDENDKVVMEFDAEVARKIDDEHIEMENLKIIAFDDEGKQIKIDLPESIFNVGTRILTGTKQIVIEREDFEIVGETGEFNTKTRFAKMLGDVKMTILNTENLAQ